MSAPIASAGLDYLGALIDTVSASVLVVGAGDRIEFANCAAQQRLGEAADLRGLRRRRVLDATAAPRRCAARIAVDADPGRRPAGPGLGRCVRLRRGSPPADRAAGPRQRSRRGGRGGLARPDPHPGARDAQLADPDLLAGRVAGRAGSGQRAGGDRRCGRGDRPPQHRADALRRTLPSPRRPTGAGDGRSAGEHPGRRSRDADAWHGGGARRCAGVHGGTGRSDAGRRSWS